MNVSASGHAGRISRNEHVHNQPKAGTVARKKAKKVTTVVVNMSSPTIQSVSPSPSAASENPNGGDIWEVQEILAERTTRTGENEMLVVWKTSWIPVSNLHANGPVIRRWNEERKWSSCATCENAAMQVSLPVEPGSRMAGDLATFAALRAVLAPHFPTFAARSRDTADDKPSKARRCATAQGESDSLDAAAD